MTTFQVDKHNPNILFKWLSILRYADVPYFNV